MDCVSKVGRAVMTPTSHNTVYAVRLHSPKPSPFNGRVEILQSNIRIFQERPREVPEVIKKGWASHTPRMMNEVFGEENFRNEIDLKRTRTLKGEVKKFHTSNDTLFFYARAVNSFIFRGYKRLKEKTE